MKQLILTTLLFSIFIGINAQDNFIINPMPQNILYKNGKVERSIFFSGEKFNPKKVLIGEKTHKKLKKYAKKVPNRKEGYYLSIDKNNILVIGNDPRGTFYGLQTLKQLLKNETLPTLDITDFPDLAHRGVVEGFYGTPWSHEKRLRQLDYYGANKLNVYIYGPKDDPYHSSPNWRMPYPEKEVQQIKALIDKANENYVDFVWAIHPGKDIKWNDTDRKNLINKFELMYQLGVRAFAVFFDDISGEGTNPEKQAELLNYLHHEFVAKKKDVKPLIMCPTEYNKSWSDPNKKYLETLGNNLHQSIQIMWTGDRVVADISKLSMDWINAKIKRKAYIWWNFPVSDYVRDHMLLGAVYGNDLNIKNDMSGFVSNPMEHAEASKIAIYGVANYTWNLEQYNADATWKNAIADVMPHHKDALFTFAKHNSDLGINGHRYRREESVDFKPTADSFLSNFDKGLKNPYLPAVKEEFGNIISASEILLNTKENQYFTDEIKPWIIQFGTVGKLGETITQMYEAYANQDKNTFKIAYKKVQNYQKQMYDNDQTLNQNPYQPGVKTATLVIEPLLNKTLEKLIISFNKKYDEHLKLNLNFNPNTLITNIPQIENVALLQRGKSVRISPTLEFINMDNHQFFGIELKHISNVKNISINLENDKAFENGNIQITNDGNTWQTIEGEVKKGRWTNNTIQSATKGVRFISHSENTLPLKIKQFEITIE